MYVLKCMLYICVTELQVDMVHKNALYDCDGKCYRKTFKVRLFFQVMKVLNVNKVIGIQMENRQKENSVQEKTVITEISGERYLTRAITYKIPSLIRIGDRVPVGKTTRRIQEFRVVILWQLDCNY